MPFADQEKMLEEVIFSLSVSINVNTKNSQTKTCACPKDTVLKIPNFHNYRPEKTSEK